MIVRVIDLDISQPIDFVTPVDNLGGQQGLFVTMLKRLEVLSLSQCMSQVAEGVNEGDWGKMKAGAHQLKGASGYVGAGRVHYACYHIQNCFHQDDFEGMVAYYPFLVEYCIEFKRFSRKYLTELQGKPGRQCERGWLVARPRAKPPSDWATQDDSRLSLRALFAYDTELCAVRA